MSFSHHSILFLAIIPAMMIFWIWRRRDGGVVMPFDHGSQSSGTAVRFLVQLAESLPSLILLVVLLILAGPQKTGEPKTRRVLTNIEFCVDVSGSMTASFGEGTRYDASMEAINRFLDFREGDAFGLTFFGVEVLHWVPLTTDVSAFRCAPQFMNPKNPGHPPWLGGTRIGKALSECRKVLASREEGDRMIVLISDGSSSDLFGDATEDLIRKLRADNISVYAVHIASGNIPDPIIEITARTGGEVFSPGDQDGLESVFRHIDEMQETRMEKVAAETTDNYVPFCISGLSLLGISLLGLFGIRFTPW
ncbi:MAG: VWA domain-containing protein [Planctomycetaceae bacterium]|nr:VWA domain-containing protein [Planctomycetaceae bacterium]